MKVSGFQSQSLADMGFSRRPFALVGGVVSSFVTFWVVVMVDEQRHGAHGAHGDLF